jgi:hypothetical protein
MHKHHFFLSHSSNDTNSIVTPVADLLKTQGKTIWLDVNEIQPGDNLTKKISDGLATSDLVVAFISKSYISSNWAMQELGTIMSIEISNGKLRLIPILIDINITELHEKLPLISNKVFLIWDSNPITIVDKLIKLHNQMLEPFTQFKNILFDQAHRQERWRGFPTIDAEYKDALKSISDFTTVRVNLNQKFSRELLKMIDVLIFPTPYGMKIDDEEYEELSKWIYEGGSLLTFGFYLMELHHFFNLNRLARRLGFEFNKDLIMPKGKEDKSSCMGQPEAYLQNELWLETKPKVLSGDHPIVHGVDRLVLLSACSLEYLTTDCELCVTLSDKVWSMKARGECDPSGHLRRILEYYKNKLGKHIFLIANKHGRGKFIGIGTWKIFLNAFIQNNSIDNKKLFQNCIRWLSDK